MGKYFGTDGFRGEANRELRAEHAFDIGRFLGWYLGKENRGRRVRVAIGKDTRRSSYQFEYALAAGLCASGADAYILHVIPTPGVSFVTRTEGFDCGVMISASHNPFSDNGIKLVNGNGEKADDELISMAEAYLDRDFATLGVAGNELPLAHGEDIGRVVDNVAGRNRYVGYLISVATHSFQPLRVGLDPSNGSAWHIARAVFEALGARVYTLHDTPDGVNINRDAGSTHISSLCEFVRAYRLDVGFAFDGDADRCIAVDERGEAVNGDCILYLLAAALKRVGGLAGNTVVGTVMSNMGLRRALADIGIEYEETAVGDRYVYESMVRHGYELGGEQSGHMILRKYATTGDGILTAIRIAEEMLGAKEPLSKLVAPMTAFPQVTVNIPVTDKQGVLSDGILQSEIGKLRAQLGDEGRIVLRPSGTEPVLRVMTEAATAELCKSVSERAVALVRATAEAKGMGGNA